MQFYDRRFEPEAPSYLAPGFVGRDDIRAPSTSQGQPTVAFR
jgi:hypothetical protein